jgi:hypothetical protein
MSALGRLRHEDCEFQVSLGYTVRLSQRKKKQNKTEMYKKMMELRNRVFM